MSAEHETKPSTFRGFILTKCNDQGISRIELASQTEVSQSYLSKLLSGRIKQPSAGILVRMLRTVGVDSFDEVQDFFKSDEEKALDRNIDTALEQLPDVKSAYSRLNPLLPQKRFFLRLLSVANLISAEANTTNS